jgi:hypothetical protein
MRWQTTCGRREAWAEADRIPGEEDKPEGEQGKYLHPEGSGKPKALGVGSLPLQAASEMADGLPG